MGVSSMLNVLKKNNPDIEFYSVFDTEFETFGKVFDINTSEILSFGDNIEVPEGISYLPSVEDFENMCIARELENEFYGSLPIQVGLCMGHSTMMNATEWHTSNEINIAITDLVLILGHRWDIHNDKIDSSLFKAFYVPKGTVVEVFSTSLHYCPCQVNDAGFKCVVVLPKDTNTAVETEVLDKRITAKNKWLIAHVENEAKIKQGAVAGITGINYEIKY